MAVITNDVKRKGHAELHTTETLFKAFSSGQSVLLSNFEIDSQNSIRFISSSAFAIDVDDDERVTDPLHVLDFLKDICAGLFYTFSHGKKGNRYRLLFQLDQSITNQEDFADLIDYMLHYLKNKGLPVDSLANKPTQIIRGGSAGYEVNDLSTVLNIDTWLQAAKVHSSEKRKAIEARRAKNLKDFDESLHTPLTFDELKKMCEAIGHIPSGEGFETTKKWLNVTYAIKHQVILDLITDDEGFELFNIVSGDESNERQWNGIKPSGAANVGSIVHHAKLAGYKHRKSYAYALQETQEVIETEHIKIKRVRGEKTYIPTEVAKELIQRKQRLLVESDTGSGKTRSFVTGFKELANKDYHYYIFSVPTIGIALQTAQSYDIPCIIGGMENVRSDVTTRAVNGQRVFTCTYDKAAELMSYLSTGIDYGMDQQPSFTVVIDEYHKFVEAYGYRNRAINDLNQSSNIAVSLIGLSGTTDEIIKADFDKMIVIDTDGGKSPCLDYRVFTYDTRVDGETVAENADLMLVPVIRGLLQQTRVLVFINNKERIERIVRLLKKEGIKSSVVTSDSKQSSTYKDIVENESIADDVQVVIATVVIADGVNIVNGLNWSCLVVADDNSPIFNTSTVKQISNRFRNQYRYFGIYMRTPNPNYDEVKRFNIELDYRYKMKTVRRYVDYLNEEFKEESLQEFVPSLVEANNGIYYKSTDDAALIEFNPLFVRHQSMITKERYYTSHRNAFIKEIGRLIGHKLTGIFNVNEEVARNGTDSSGLLAEIEVEKAEIKLEADELRENFAEAFNEDVYLAFVHRDNDDLLERFKKEVHADQYAACFKNARITDYETCHRLGRSVKRRADINRYIDDVQALADIAKFEHIKKIEVTKKVFNELLKMTSKQHLSSDFKEHTEKVIPKKLKVKSSDVKAALKLFHKETGRMGASRYATITPLTIKLVADNENRFISEDAVKLSLLKLVDSKKGHDQKIFFPAIEKKYGVTRGKI